MNGTEPKQERDNWIDNRLTPSEEKPNERNSEAGWRRGYAADCKAPLLSCENSALAENSYQDKAGTSGERDNRPLTRHSIISKSIEGRHKRAARILGYALITGDRATWNVASAVWSARLDASERQALATAALLSLDPADAYVVAENVFDSAGDPLPPFLDPIDDATFWAGMASLPELRAYCLAAFVAMPRREQLDFIEFAQGECA